MLGLKPIFVVFLSALLTAQFVAASASAGIFVDDVVTTDVPHSISVDRSDGINNVITWQPPTDSDGRTLIGFYLYRYPSPALFSPAQAIFISGATTTTYSDSWGFSRDMVYFLSALFEDGAGVKTESVPMGPIFVDDTHNCRPLVVDSSYDDPIHWDIKVIECFT